MRAVVCQDTDLQVTDLPDPQPGPGQVLLDVLRCGICGSDLHARHHADAQADVLAEAGYDGFMRTSQQVVFGHEFTGAVEAFGPDCARKIKPGTPVVALPLIRHGKDVHAIGLSASAPGGYAEKVVVQESLMLPIPNGLSPDLATLTEPLAVGWHAVQRADIGKKDVAVVIGCGPVGLAVIAMLKTSGIRTVVASDLSPGRRSLATACGADIVVDPQVDSPYATAEQHGAITTIPAKVGLGLTTMDKLTKLPVPWHHIWRAADAVGVTDPKRPVVFECVGIPGILEDIISHAPLASRIVVAGVCMTPDTIRPAMAINKEIDLRFVVGYTPLEFRDTLHMLADGKVNAAPMLTGVVGLDDVEKTFDALQRPETQAKVLIDPSRR